MSGLWDKKFIIFYVGFDSEKRMRILKRMIEGGFSCGGVLVSYWYLRDKANQENVLSKLSELKEMGVNTMLDSGAFSILNAWDRMRGKTGLHQGFEPSKEAMDVVKSGKSGVEDFYNEYVEFLKEYGKVFDIVVEMDLQTIVGDDKVDEWRKELCSVHNGTMFVWHGESNDILDDWVKRTSFIGVSGTKRGRDTHERMRASRYIRDKRDDVWIHWFGFSDFNELPQLVRSRVINSGDSTSWVSGEKYGAVYMESAGKIYYGSYKDNIQKFRMTVRKYWDELVQYGLEVDKILNYLDSTQVTFYSMVVCEKHVSKLRELYGVEGMDSSERADGFCCIVCGMKERCSAYIEGSTTCRLIEDKIGEFEFDELEVDVLKVLIRERLKRYIRARLFEELDGGVLDRQVTLIEDGLAKLVETYLKLKYPERYSGRVKYIEETDISEILNRLNEVEK